ncbi:CHALLAH, epidermis patterning factor (EPF1)-like 6 [Hibiscus trionum]|uniref:Epidermal patterning factor-like protein n=1 Tax=Hibiscus trionum TaxID=183268 RepID=A0A9W7JG25_HIBTR|nr:CHALLAH, epidermis patterning factor (EPF1)-like 6 [Hibiscus trionum]
MESKGHRKQSLKSQLLYCFFSLFFFSVCLLVSITGTATTCQQDIRFLLFSQAAGDICSQEISQKNEVAIPVDIQVDPLSLGRRFLSGPGSSPPLCVSKCGNCTPCKPVHVSVPPGTPVTEEYYPEAWRCKCGNKLYMP